MVLYPRPNSEIICNRCNALNPENGLLLICLQFPAYSIVVFGLMKNQNMNKINNAGEIFLQYSFMWTTYCQNHRINYKSANTSNITVLRREEKNVSIPITSTHNKSTVESIEITAFTET